MRSNILFVSALAAAFVSAAEIETDDIPDQCRDICSPVVQLAERCDNNTDGDGAERDCICEAQNATPFTSCNECTLQYPEYFVDDDDDDDDDDNEVNIWFNRCNFAAGGAVTSAPSSTGTVVPVSTSVSVSCDDDDDDDNNNCSTSSVVVVSPTSVPVTPTSSGASPAPTAGGNTNNNDDDNNNVSTVTVGGMAAATGVPAIAAGVLAMAMAAL